MKVSVLNLRNRFKQKNASVPTVPGCYCFWFDNQGMQKILKPLESACTRKLQKKVIDGKDCYALYFGIAKNLKDRAPQHVFSQIGLPVNPSTDSICIITLKHVSI